MSKLRAHPFFATINWKQLLEKKITPPFKPKVVCDETFHFDSAFTTKTPKGEYRKGTLRVPLGNRPFSMPRFARSTTKRDGT
jgi:hypothetical protein